MQKSRTEPFQTHRNCIKRRKDKYENIFTDPFHGELLGALESAIREQGYYMMIYISEDIEEIVRNIVGWNTEGLILIGMLHDDYLKIRSKYKTCCPYRQLHSKEYCQIR